MALKEFLRDALKADLGIDPAGGKMTIKGDVRTPQDADVNILTSANGDKVDIHNGAGNPVDVCAKSIKSGGLKTEPFGHHLSSRLDNRAFQTVYAGTPVTDEGSNGTVFFPKFKAVEERIVTHGNAGDLSGPLQDGAAPEFVGDFTEAHLLAPGESYPYNVVPQQPYFLRRIYYKIAPGVNVGIGDSIRAHAYRGTDESGVKIYDHTTYATAENIGAFVAGAEFPAIITNQITNGIDYAQGEELHWVLKFDSDDPTHRAAFYTLVGGASPWRAVDRQQEEHVALVPVSTIFAAPVITSPVEGATGVSLTPQIDTVKGASKYGSHQSSTDIIAPGNTTENTIFSIPMAPDFIGSKGSIVGTILFLNSANANIKTYKLKLGGTIIFSGDAPNALNSALNFSIYSQGASQMTVASITGGEEIINNTAVDTSVATMLQLTVQKSVAGDSIIMQHYDMFITNGDSDLVGEYEHGGTVVKVRRNSDQAIIYDNNKVSGLSDTLPTPLTGATQYSVQAAHYNSLDVPIGRSVWVNFQTALDIFIVNFTGLTGTNNAVELLVGESVNSAAFDFHMSGLATDFPPAAYDSGNIDFTDMADASIPFVVTSVTGTAPNRTARCLLFVDAPSQVKMKEVGVVNHSLLSNQTSYIWEKTATEIGNVAAMYNTDGLTAGNLAQWNDLSSFNAHGVQGNAALQPIVTENILNGYPSLSFASRYFTAPVVMTSGMSTIIAVTQRPAVPNGNGNTLLGTADTSSAFAAVFNGPSSTTGRQRAIHENVNWLTPSAADAPTGWHIAEWVWDDPNNLLSYYINSGANGTASYATAMGGTSIINIGTRVNNATLSLNAPLADLIICNTVKPTADRHWIEASLFKKYNLSSQGATLDAGNTYVASEFNKLQTGKFSSIG